MEQPPRNALDSKNTEITADFPYYVVKHLRKSQGCPVAYFTGTVGGLMTTLHLPVKDADGKELADGTFAKSERYGTLVGNLRTRRSEERGGSVSHAVRHPARGPSSCRWRTSSTTSLGNSARSTAACTPGTGTRRRKKFTPTKEISKPVAVKTEVGYLKLGDLEVAVIPGEIYPELVLGKVQDPADPGADFPNAPIEPAIYRANEGQAPDDRRSRQ